MQIDASYSPEDNKLRLYASARLDAETYARVKAAGFSWAPKQDLFVAPMWTPARADLCIELAGEIGDEDKSLVDRAAERAERFEDYEDKRASDAASASAYVHRIADGIPMGQPILVGHHSEKHARKDAERIENGMRRAVQMWETSQYWKQRAAGALAHAKYREDPGVRHRRIKGLESDQRKQQKSHDESAALMAAWSREGLTLEQAKAIANGSGYDSMCFTLADYPRDPPASQYEGPMGLWSALDGGVISAEQARAIAMRRYPRYIAHARRWLDHIENRITYERAMLDEAGGIAAEKFDLQPGGIVSTTRGRRQVIVRVNRKDGRVLSVTVAGQSWTVGIEEITGYEPPSETAAAAVAAAVKLAPICNYPSDGIATMAQAEWNSISKDHKGTRNVKATETQGAHRRRMLMGFLGTKYGAPRGDAWGYTWVFISDAKRTDPADLTAPAKVPRKSMARKIAEAADIDTSNTPETAAPAAPTLRDIMAEANTPALSDMQAEAARLRARNDARDERTAEAAPFDAMKESLRAGVAVVVAPQLFESPRALAAQMVGVIDIKPGSRICEPEGGTGRIVKAIANAIPLDQISLQVIEINAQLAASLRARFPAARVLAADFLNCHPAEFEPFDFILMNPPFAGGADVEHVSHALRFLAPGGRLVAIMSAGVTFRDDRKTRAFRETVDRMGGTIEPLPDGTFETSGTGVRTVLVVIDADDEPAAAVAIKSAATA